MTITTNLTGGSTSDLIVTLPQNVTLIINGNGGSTRLVGGSPALTVRSGHVILCDMTFSNTTNTPTILVTGGTLTLRNDVVQETPKGSQAAIAITGGTVDLGTAAAPGGNTLNINGTGLFIANTGPNAVAALGDTFENNGVVLTDPYRIADAILDALDAAGRGLVTFVAGSVYVTRQSGSIQRAVNAAPAGDTIDVQAGGSYANYTVGSKPLTLAFQDGPTLQLAADAAFAPDSTTLRVTGGPQNYTHITIQPGGRAGTVDVAVDALFSLPAALGGLLPGHRVVDVAVDAMFSLPLVPIGTFGPPAASWLTAAAECTTRSRCPRIHLPAKEIT